MIYQNIILSDEMQEENGWNFLSEKNYILFKPGLPGRNSRNFIGASCHILPVCEKLNFVKWRKK